MADKKGTFAIKPKKSPFQLHKEAEEAKKKRLDEEAAQVYEEFVASFDTQSAQPGTKAFVRGGVVEPGSRPSSEPTAGGDKKLGTKYVPSFIPPSMAAARRNEKPASVFDLPARVDKSKPRAIDSVLEEMQREQHQREARRERTGFDVAPEDLGAAHGSHDTGDPHTTNLYVGNLAPSLDEHMLKLAFGKFGPIASVKVMWPRDEDQRTRGRMSGFVAFMTRQAAEEAFEVMQGRVLHDSELRLGWSKPVPLPAVPCWPPPASMEPGFSFGVGAHHVPTPAASGSSAAASRAPVVEVLVPQSARRIHLIDTLASFVAVDGAAFEQLVVQRERDNPEFAFVTDYASREHVFYKWRVYSLSQGDSLSAWREEPFEMLHGGSIWKPPKADDVRVAAAGAADAPGADSTAQAERELTEAERDAFEDALRGLTVERSSVCSAMLFALDHADAAGEVSDTLVQALCLRETPAPTKVARLFLLSDILHSSGCARVRNAAAYRTHLLGRLPDVFESLNDLYSSLDSRIAAQALRRHVTAVLRAWASWFVFGERFLAGLEATFLRAAGGATLVAEDALQAELEGLSAEQLERRCRDSGLPAHSGSAACVARLLALDSFRRVQRGEALVGAQRPADDADAAKSAERPARQERGAWTVVTEDDTGAPATGGAQPAAAHVEQADKRAHSGGQDPHGRKRSRSRSRSPGGGRARQQHSPQHERRGRWE